MTGASADVEVAPETSAYRQHRHMIWQTLRARYAQSVADAIDAGQDDGDARTNGARAVREDMRAMMSELLVRAPVPAVLEFLSRGLEWGAAGERIFERSDEVIALIESAHPGPTWTDLEVLGRDAAGDDAHWSAWSLAWLQTIRATGAAARAILDERPAPSATSAPESPPVLIRWAPWLAGAAAMIGVTAVVAVSTRE